MLGHEFYNCLFHRLFVTQIGAAVTGGFGIENVLFARCGSEILLCHIAGHKVIAPTVDELHGDRGVCKGLSYICRTQRETKNTGLQLHNIQQREFRKAEALF